MDLTGKEGTTMKMTRWIPVSMVAALLVAFAAGTAVAQPDPPGDDSDGWSAPGGGWGFGGGGRGGAWGGHGGHGGMMMMRGGGGGMMLLGPEGRLLRGQGWLADQLKLTGTQRGRLREIGDNLMRQQIKSRADLALARLDLRSLLQNDTPSQSSIDNKINQIVGIQGDMMKAGVTAKLQVRNLLTPDQRKQLENMRSTRRAMRRGGSGPQGGSSQGSGSQGNRPKGT
jgi:Spy/CpxP family protein refolding chaperone